MTELDTDLPHSLGKKDMHTSALKTAQLFFATYVARNADLHKVVDIGSMNVNGSLRDVCPNHLSYTGVDFAAGLGVDVVLDDPYKLPFEDESVDVAVSSSVFEHSEMFWILFLEILRILKPHGLFYLNVPSNGAFHRFPVDCWRFYPESGKALATWAKRNGFNTLLLESFIGQQDGPGMWNDFVAVFLKDESAALRYGSRIMDSKSNFINGMVHNREGFLNGRQNSEDQERLIAVNMIVSGQLRLNWQI